MSLLSRRNVKSLGLSLLVLGCAAACAAAATAKFDPCSLLTRREIEEVQGDRVVSTKASEPERDRFAVSQCFYSLATFSKSVSLEVTRRAPGQGGNDPAERWERMFRAEAGEGDRDAEEGKEHEREFEKAERTEGREIRGIEKEKSPPVRVDGVGDEAFWIGNRASGVLYALRGHAYVRVSVGGAGTEHEKRAKAVELARKVMRRL